MKVFQFVILYHPTDDEKKSGENSKIIGDMKTIVANDQAQATMLAGRSIPDEYMTKIDRLEVAVRPF